MIIFIRDDNIILQNFEFVDVNNIYFWLIKNRNSIMLEHLPIEACDFYSYQYKIIGSIIILIK